MKKVFCLSAVFALAATFVSCSKDSNMDLDSADVPNLELRAATLGFSDVNAYTASVAGQCAAGNHENCCILSGGTHFVCPYPHHRGINCDGTPCNGNSHATNAHRGHGRGKGYGNGQHLHDGSDGGCSNFADADNNGVCDNCGTSSNGCSNFVDTDNDGICDNCGTAKNKQDVV